MVFCPWKSLKWCVYFRNFANVKKHIQNLKVMNNFFVNDPFFLFSIVDVNKLKLLDPRIY